MSGSGRGISTGFFGTGIGAGGGSKLRSTGSAVIQVSDSFLVTLGMLGIAVTITTASPRTAWKTSVNVDANGDRGIWVS